MSDSQLLNSNLAELSQLIKQRKISPIELTNLYLQRIEARNPELNAFVYIAAENARQQAAASEKKVISNQAAGFEGIPIAIKDNRYVADMPTRHGSKLYDDTPATFESHVVSKLQQNGFVFLGKTTMPEFGTLASTEAGFSGACRNPWNPKLIVGGSSGGSAAAVAAHMIPIAHGNDSGGSLRIPASTCGVFTLKPTRGRVSLAPTLGEGPMGMGTEGFMTRTVADNQTLLNLVSGYVTGDPYIAPNFPVPTKPLRIGWTVTPPTDGKVCSQSIAAVKETAELCQRLGHQVEEHTPLWKGSQVFDWFMEIWAVAIAWAMNSAINAGGDPTLADPHNVALWEKGKSISAPEYLATTARLHAFIRLVMKSWEIYDVILTPTLAELPLPIGEAFNTGSSDPMFPLMRFADFTPFTPIVNFTGQPAAQLPLSWQDGLPVGTQAIGRYGEEATLFQLTTELESAKPWHEQLAYRA